MMLMTMKDPVHKKRVNTIKIANCYLTLQKPLRHFNVKLFI